MSHLLNMTSQLYFDFSTSAVVQDSDNLLKSFENVLLGDFVGMGFEHPNIGQRSDRQTVLLACVGLVYVND
jgi:hypothetical protein